ncbi:NADPH oxidase 5-like [Lineus longissimus]|uniref:NADPH oxidase 5-like n=1 Tax=Lineus longissimus TaxID=88925 RepID=UPI00315D0366
MPKRKNLHVDQCCTRIVTGFLDRQAIIVHSQGASNAAFDPSDVEARGGYGPRGSTGDKDDRRRSSSDDDYKWIGRIERKFKEVAGDRDTITYDQFVTALGLERTPYSRRYFVIFDKDNSGEVDLDELIDNLKTLIRGTATDRLSFLFKIYDADDSGSIDVDELRAVLKACIEESQLRLTEDDLDALTLALFEYADTDQSGLITFEELEKALDTHKDVKENLTISAVNWLIPKQDKPKRKFECSCPRHLSANYLRNNIRKVVFVTLFTLVVAGLGIYGGYLHRNDYWCVTIARICGKPINFLCTALAVLMLRRCLTLVRNTRIAPYLPLDQHIMFHKMAAIMAFILSVVHTVAHIGNFANAVRTKAVNFTLVECLFTTRPGIGWVAGMASISGWVLLVIFIILVICSLPVIRRSGHFEVFYWTHMLYVPFWVMCILHAPDFWKWFCVPGFLLLCEKLSSLKMFQRTLNNYMYIRKVALYPSNVTQLMIKRPRGFNYQPGDYIYILLPELAEHEWHPFTISSAPENKDYVWVHIRSAGNWTSKLYKHFATLQEPGLTAKRQTSFSVLRARSLARRQRSETGARPASDDRKGPNLEPNGGPVQYGSFSESPKLNGAQDDELEPDGTRYKDPLKLEMPSSTVSFKSRRKISAIKKTVLETRHKAQVTSLRSPVMDVILGVYVDGPYGTSTREIFDTEHAVLIAAGIGVTPFASILQSVMFRYIQSKSECPSCGHTWHEDGLGINTLKKVDFIWINRDQQAFEWFTSLLTQLEKELMVLEDDESNRFLEMQMYMTRAVKRNDMTGVGLHMALELLHEKESRDVLTGLKTRTQPGRPKWNKVFKELSKANRGRVKVFFCGSPAIAKELKKQCQYYNFEFSQEHF